MPFQGFLRSNRGTPPRGQSISLFSEKFLIPNSWSRSTDVGFLALAAFMLGKVGKDQEGGGEGVPGGWGGGSRGWRCAASLGP